MATEGAKGNSEGTVDREAVYPPSQRKEVEEVTVKTKCRTEPAT